MSLRELVVMTCVLPACAATVASGDGAVPADATTGDATPIDVIAADTTLADTITADAAPADVGLDAAPDASCAPGTCRVRSDGVCEQPTGPQGNACCGCDAGVCTARCVCASPETPIATPDGDRPIASLRVGELVFSVHAGRLVAVPILRVNRTAVVGHRVVRATLGDGRELHISAGHPTADGRTFRDLRAGDWLGGRRVLLVEVVPYEHEATYDILPDSDTGTYLAGGALIGSTLAGASSPMNDAQEACVMPARLDAPPPVSATSL